MRLFVAIFPTENVTRELGLLPGRTARPALRWIPAVSLHLTLKFLGDTPLPRVAKVESALEAVTAGRRRFTLIAAGGSTFPDLSRPRVFWAGLSGDVESAADLAAAVEDALGTVGLAREARAFSPHLTVARCRPGARCGKDDAAAFAAAAAQIVPAPFPVDAVHLVESHLGGSGARYEIKRSFPLAA